MSLLKYFRNIQRMESVLVTKRSSALIQQDHRPVCLATRLVNKQINTFTENKNTADLTEQQFLVKLKTDPDKFGDQSPEETIIEEDLKEEAHFTEQPLPSQKLSTKKYADLIKNLINQRKIKEAIDVVEVRMLKEDRVKPENYIYNLLLGACGRIGYTKKAFMLFNDMKKRGLQVTGGTYTALFNACANSPWPLTDGLSRAKHLRNIMIEKRYEPNDTNYNAMIKAFGRCGDLSMAFSLVDEMISKGFVVKDDTINFLLQGCISEKEVGFRHALLVWRTFNRKKIKPSIYTFNLLLRSVRDCGLGDLEVTRSVIDSICDEKKLLGEEKQEDKNKLEKREDDINLVERNPSADNCRPNLLAEVPHLGNIISLSEIIHPEHRLLLIGGCKGFLETIKRNECVPNIKTFTQLLECIPSSLASEKELLNAMKNLKVQPDIDFFNMLIKKRSMRFDYENAKEVLDLMKRQNYKPNLITYGVLALGCKHKGEGEELIEHLKEKSYSLNAEILGAMLHQACYHFSFWYVIYIVDTLLKEGVKPNKKFMETLTEFGKRTKELHHQQKLKPELEKNYRIFRARYKSWIQEIQVDETEDEHPWKQFRGNTDEDYKYTPKDSERFKPRRTSVFRVKTSLKRNK